MTRATSGPRWRPAGRPLLLPGAARPPVPSPAAGPPAGSAAPPPAESSAVRPTAQPPDARPPDARSPAERSAVSDRTPRPTAPGAGTVLLAVLRRDSGEGHLLRWPLVLDICFGVINLAVFLLVSQWVAVGGPAGRGESTFAFVAVGVSYLLVVQVACTQVALRVREEQQSGTLEALVTSGAPLPVIGLASALYPALVGSLRCVLYLVGAGVFLGLPLGRTHWVGVLVLLALGGLVALALATVLAAAVVAVPHGGTIGRVALAALGLASGVFVPVAQLPGPLHAIGMLLPTRPVLDGLRAAVAGTGWATPAWLSAVWALVLLPVAGALYGGAVRVARRRGALSRV